MPAEDAAVRAGTDGEIVETFAHSGAEVVAGAQLVRMRDDEGDAIVAIARARREEIDARIAAAVRDPEVLEVLFEERAFLDRQVAQAEGRTRELEVAARTSGAWLPAFEPSLSGRHFARGELIGHVVDPARLRLIAVVDEEQILPVRERTVRVSVLGATLDREVHTLRAVRLMPTATHALPHPSLATDGGGRIALRSDSGDRLEAVRKFFWVELDLAGLPAPCLDCRAEVRFEHPAEPVAFRWGRWFRRQFLRLLDD